jgi:predicted nucleic acid-binding protein
VLDFENDANPHPRQKKEIQKWKKLAKMDIEESQPLLLLMESFEKRRLKSADALHLACAVMGNADFFITVDHGILNKSISEIQVINPEQFVRNYMERK